MNLHRIRTFIAGFQQDLPRSPFVWAWEVQSTFQQNWNLEAPNLPEMLDKSLYSIHKVWVSYVSFSVFTKGFVNVVDDQVVDIIECDFLLASPQAGWAFTFCGAKK